MYNVVNTVFHGVMVISVLWIVRKYLGIFYEKKKENILSAACWCLFIVFQIYLQIHSGDASIWNTVINIILVISLMLTGYYGGKKSFFEVLLLYVIWALIEMFVYFFMNMMPFQKSNADIVGTVISRILMIIGVYTVSLFWKKTKNSHILSPKYYLGLVFVPVGSIYIAATEFFAENRTPDMISSMITFSILLAFNIIILEMYSKITDSFLLEKERAVYAQQINMVTMNTEGQKRLMENFHRERHDLVNKLIVLKSKLENDGKDAVLMDIDKIIDNCSIGEVICNSGNDIVDALMNVKYAAAKEKGISFVLKILIPEDLPIDQCDMGVILGNAIDNAIEATEKCLHHEKMIEIIMTIKKGALVLIVKNPYENTLKTDKMGDLLTTKKNSDYHGYGISSIRKVAEKYGGDVDIDDEDGNTFVLTVTMNLGNFDS